ncbi:hypothetical protein [Streptomyces sp. NPDC096095]|uniref:hypothetical protein n=1 Tax=Streptomyces sp. NPDC096095 TaxID=3155545 RepID=UPI003327AEF1
MDIFVLLADGQKGDEIDFVALIFFLCFGSVGAALALNFRGFADSFLRFTSMFMLGWMGGATARTLRFVGIVMGLLSLIGVVTQVSVPFRD